FLDGGRHRAPVYHPDAVEVADALLLGATPGALQRRIALGQWYDARSAAWIGIQKGARYAGGSPGRVPGGYDLPRRRDHRATVAGRSRPHFAAPVVRRARLACAKSGPPPRVEFMLERPRTLGMVAAKLATRPRGSEV